MEVPIITNQAKEMAQRFRRYEGVTVLVTGAGSGLGAVTAQWFGYEGANVVAVDRNGEAAQQVAAELRLNGVKALAVQADVTIEADCQRMVEECLAMFGTPQVIFASAGIIDDGVVFPKPGGKEMTVEKFLRVLQVNVVGVHLSVDAVVKAMKEERDRNPDFWGRVIIPSSVVGVYGGTGQLNYATAKAGLLGYVDTLALELARFGITVNAIVPGYIETAMSDEVPDDVWAKIIPMVPVRRKGQPEEVAYLVVFLASEFAGFFTRGHYPVDGGVHLP